MDADKPPPLVATAASGGGTVAGSVVGNFLTAVFAILTIYLYIIGRTQEGESDGGRLASDAHLVNRACSVIPECDQ